MAPRRKKAPNPAELESLNPEGSQFMQYSMWCIFSKILLRHIFLTHPIFLQWLKKKKDLEFIQNVAINPPNKQTD